MLTFLAGVATGLVALWIWFALRAAWDHASRSDEGE